jgi:CRP-like cAMP-binding protein
MNHQLVVKHQQNASGRPSHSDGAPTGGFKPILIRGGAASPLAPSTTDVAQNKKPLKLARSGEAELGADAAPALLAPRRNQLLASLPAEDYARLRRQLELVEWHDGQVLQEPDMQLRCVYFPIDTVVSMLYLDEDGGSTEIAVVGNEGVVGTALFMGGATSPYHAVVRTAGHAFRLATGLLNEEFKLGGALHDLLLRYAHATTTQIAQTAVCNRHHRLEKQLCRWLLSRLDRLPSNVLSTTQELIANLLGVRREGVTRAAGNLQAAGLIECRRGNITVLDRKGLEARVCECYAVIKSEFDGILPARTAG